jgi:hypothetical protein
MPILAAAFAGICLTHAARSQTWLIMNETDKQKLIEQEEERDFFCIVNDLFRIFARRFA